MTKTSSSFLPRTRGQWGTVTVLLVIAAGGLLVARCTLKRMARGASAAGRDAEPLDIPMTNLTIPLREVMPGGPPKDGIPSLVNAATVAAAESPFSDEERVVGLVVGGVARAYPLGILNWHEAANDVVGGKPVLVTYCPLCDSAAAFDRQVDGATLEFGISGLLYNSNMLFYSRALDPNDQSLWSQVALQAVSGKYSGTRLANLPVDLTTWGAWRERHPETDILSTDTGHPLDYLMNPYGSYFEDEMLMFPVAYTDERLPIKERIVGVRVGDQTYAYPLRAIAAAGGSVSPELGEAEVTITLEADGRGARIEAQSDGVETVHTFWFAWAAMHPDTELMPLPDDAATAG